MIEAALELARCGWSVFPCQWIGPRAKAPLGHLTPRGHLEASSDPAVITGWWRAYPQALVGGPVPSSLLVLDIDPRNGGSLEVLEARLGHLPPTLTAWSGRGDGGRHLYFRRPPGALVSTGLPAGVDLKVNGYCILPPSRHPATGAPYEWEQREAAVLPAGAVTALRPRVPAGRPLVAGLGGSKRAAALVRTVADAPEGARASVLFWAFCRAVEEEQPAGVLDDLAAAARAAGLRDSECRSARRSAQSRYAR